MTLPALRPLWPSRKFRMLEPHRRQTSLLGWVEGQEGAIIDGNSRPWWLGWSLPLFGRAGSAVIIHDCGYAGKLRTEVADSPSRKHVDLIFRELLLRDGVPRWKAWAMYQAVRAFGKGKAWE